MAGLTTRFSQTIYRGRKDDNTRALATNIAAENTDWTQALDTNFRINFAIDFVGTAASGAFTPLFEYSTDGTTWTAITTTSTFVRATTSANFTDDAAITAKLTSDANNFVNGRMDSTGVTSAITLTNAPDCTEVEICIQLRSADFTGSGLTFAEVKVSNNGVDLFSYTAIPTISIHTTAAASQLPLVGVG
jgi:hypothetical protein